MIICIFNGTSIMFGYTLTPVISTLEYSMLNKNNIYYNYVQAKVKIIKRLTTHSFPNGSGHTSYIFQQDLIT